MADFTRTNSATVRTYIAATTSWLTAQREGAHVLSLRSKTLNDLDHLARLCSTLTSNPVGARASLGYSPSGVLVHAACGAAKTTVNATASAAQVDRIPSSDIVHAMGLRFTQVTKFHLGAGDAADIINLFGGLVNAPGKQMIGGGDLRVLRMCPSPSDELWL